MVRSRRAMARPMMRAIRPVPQQQHHRVPLVRQARQQLQFVAGRLAQNPRQILLAEIREVSLPLALAAAQGRWEGGPQARLPFRHDHRPLAQSSRGRALWATRPASWAATPLQKLE